MLSKTEIANLALAHLGSTEQIQDLDTATSVDAGVIRSQLKPVLQEVLQKHIWDFAVDYEGPLPLLESDPASGWQYAYAFPPNALLIRQIAREGDFNKQYVYEEEKVKFQEILKNGSWQLHCNVPNVHAEFTANLSEDNFFPTHFAKPVAASLAWVCGPSIITDNFAKLKAVIQNAIQTTMDEGIAIDISRKPLPEESPSPFIRARYDDYLTPEF